MATRLVSDVLRTMRLVISRRNSNDPDASDQTLFQYVQDFIALTMSDDVKVFENFGTLIFTIDQSNPTAVYTFNEVGAASIFTNISIEAWCSLLNPPQQSVSWNKLWIYQDPGEFFSIWGVNNEQILIPGFPTMMLYYGTTMTFRTIPDNAYQIQIYGYTENPEFATEPPDEVGNQVLPQAYWMRYLAYGAAVNYMRDYNYDPNTLAMAQQGYRRERALLLTRTHNQRKIVRGFPEF